MKFDEQGRLVDEAECDQSDEGEFFIVSIGDFLLGIRYAT